MKKPELTEPGPHAKLAFMGRERIRGRSRRAVRYALTGAMLGAGALPLGGCVSVNAPDKPIVIELNINIKQEVIYRLAEDARQNIDKNPEIF